MLKVPQQEYIRYLHEKGDCSVQEIAQRLQVNWRTAKKYANKDDWNEPLSAKMRCYPVLGPFIEILDTWLLEDHLLPRKQRQTGTRMFHCLTQEHAYTGSKRTVLEYVKNRKEKMKWERAQSFERLEHVEGEAQADFGTHQVARDGVFVERKVLTLSFPYSNAAFAFPVPSENTACFLEALARCFQQAGGVPRSIWFDNLSAAVVAVGKEGQRELTAAFTQFQTHYRFDSVFCNPDSGNEKGHVENKVGYGRRNWCSPPPVMADDEVFAQYLAECAKGDRQRAHYEKGVTIDSLWTTEQPCLMPLPTVPLDVFTVETRRLNSYNELSYEGSNYPVIQGKTGQLVLLRIRWNEIEVVDGSYVVLTTFPRPYMDKITPLDWLGIVENWTRRPRAVSHSAFASMLPPAVKQFLQDCEIAERKVRLALLVRLLPTYGVAEIDGALTTLTPHWPVNMALEHVLYAKRHPLAQRDPIPESHTPAAVVGHEPDLLRYDELLQVTAK
ncbi:MAG: IS21 family transposase [Bacilli bacterium]